MAQAPSAAAREATRSREAAKSGPAMRQTRILKKGLFAKDLVPMMYGFGDETPSPDTVSVMEELLIDHITEVCTQAQRISTNRGKIKIDDFKFALRKDRKKLARVDELLWMSEVIARARGRADDFAGYAAEDAPIEGAKSGAAAVQETSQAKGKGKAKK